MGASQYLIIVGLVIVLINLGILGLCLKLYTEILKDQNMNRRQKPTAASTTNS